MAEFRAINSVIMALETDNTLLTSSLGDEHGPGNQTIGDDDKGNRSDLRKKRSIGPPVARHLGQGHERTNPGCRQPRPCVRRYEDPRALQTHSATAYQPKGGRHCRALGPSTSPQRSNLPL